MKEKFKNLLYMSLNTINTVEDDPTIIEGTLIVHDFEESYNGQIITEDVCKENMQTLINKPILCRYIPKDQNGGIDGFTDHEVATDIDRETGEEIPYTNTIAIGTITDVYIEDAKFYAKAIFWAEKYHNICSLLNEFLDNGINIPMSVEYLYMNYQIQDGIQYILSPIIYTGHCVLNPTQRGDLPKIDPAYDTAKLISLNNKWNKAVASAINQHDQSTVVDNHINRNKKEEKIVADKMFKKVCELSFDDIRTALYGQLKAVLSENEYNNAWIAEVYDTYFVISYWEDSSHKYYKIPYTKTDNDTTIDWDNKKEVFLYREWKEIPEVQEVLNALEKDKTDLTTRLNDATEKITSLNSIIEELKPYKERIKKQEFNQKLNSQKEYYKAKFSAVNAGEKFDTDEVQSLIKQSVSDEKAVLQLNSILVDLVQPSLENNDPEITEISQRQEDLIPVSNDFDSRYSN
jgi:hypothetical protein